MVIEQEYDLPPEAFYRDALSHFHMRHSIDWNQTRPEYQALAFGEDGLIPARQLLIVRIPN